MSQERVAPVERGVDGADFLAGAPLPMRVDLRFGIVASDGGFLASEPLVHDGLDADEQERLLRWAHEHPDRLRELVTDPETALRDAGIDRGPVRLPSLQDAMPGHVHVEAVSVSLGQVEPEEPPFREGRHGS